MESGDGCSAECIVEDGFECNIVEDYYYYVRDWCQYVIVLEEEEEVD